MNAYVVFAEVEKVVGALLDRVNHDVVLIDDLLDSVDMSLLDSTRFVHHRDQTNDLLQPTTERVEFPKYVILTVK